MFVQIFFFFTEKQIIDAYVSYRSAIDQPGSDENISKGLFLKITPQFWSNLIFFEVMMPLDLKSRM